MLITLAFNDIADHDIAWAEFSVGYADAIDSDYIQYLMSLGLGYLRQILAAETYVARHKLLYTDYPMSNCEFLYEGLKLANREDDELYFADYTREEELARIKSMLVAESDTGPSDAWRWVNQDQPYGYFVNSKFHESLREWGYVMWDLARLNQLDVFHKPWETPDTSASANERIQRITDRRESINQRSKIFMAGGRGWWSPGDQSKIVWKYRKDQKPPGQSRTRRREPREVKSLGEARDFLASLKYPSRVQMV